MHEKPDLAALIGSRICHDLISPIGAIGNGVELMAMAPSNGDNSAELALIAQSTAAAQARLRFFRLAFGTAGGDQRIARAEFSSILADLLRGGRLRAELTGPADLSRPEAKLIALLLMCLEGAMVWGGTLRIQQDPAGEGAGWRLEAEAQRLKLGPGLWQALEQGQHLAELSPAQVQFALAIEALAQLGLKIRLTLQETLITLAF